jgi:hypothetical protein
MMFFIATLGKIDNGENFTSEFGIERSGGVGSEQRQSTVSLPFPMT